MHRRKSGLVAMKSFITIIISSWLCNLVHSFIHPKHPRLRVIASVFYDDKDDTGMNNDGIQGAEFSVEDNVSNSYISKALKKRQKDLQIGIGKRYMVRTQRGFLNVHSDTRSVYEMDNVVGRLEEGQIVTSIGPDEGEWVKHNEGGWSIRFYEGFTWLVEIDSYPSM